MDQTCNPITKKFKSKNQEQNVLKYIVDIWDYILIKEIIMPLINWAE